MNYRKPHQWSWRSFLSPNTKQSSPRIFVKPTSFFSALWWKLDSVGVSGVLGTRTQHGGSYTQGPRGSLSRPRGVPDTRKDSFETSVTGLKVSFLPGEESGPSSSVWYRRRVGWSGSLLPPPQGRTRDGLVRYRVTSRSDFRPRHDPFRGAPGPTHRDGCQRDYLNPYWNTFVNNSGPSFLRFLSPRSHGQSLLV